MKKQLLLLMAFTLCQMLVTHDIFAQSHSKDQPYLLYLTPSDIQVRETQMPGHNGACDWIERQQLPETEDDVLGWWGSNEETHTSGFLAMAKNEREGFNVFYREQQKARNIRIVTDDFVNSSGEKLAHSLYSEEFFDPCTDGMESLADALVPYSGALQVTVVNQNKAFYVELRSTKDQTPGLYTGTIKLCEDDDVLESRTVTAKVWNFALPEQHYADAMMGLYNRNSGYVATSSLLKYNGITVGGDGSIPEGQLQEAKQILQSYQEFLLDHGISTYEIPRWLIDDDPKAAELTMADPRRKMFTVPVNRGDFNGTTLTTEGHTILDKYKGLVYDNAFLKDKAFFYPMDEPVWDDDVITTFNNITDGLSQEWPDYHATIPFYYDYDQTISLFENKVDIFCPNQGFFNPYGLSGEEVADANLEYFKNHEYTWRYPGDNLCGGVYLYVSPLLQPGVMRRILFWQQYALDSKGVLFWNCAYFPDDVWSTKKLPACGLRNTNGDGILIYPGLPIGQDRYTPIASLRLKQFANGIDDFDYLKLLEEFSGEETACQRLKEILYSLNEDEPLCHIINKETGFVGWTCSSMFQTRYRIGQALSEANTEHDWGEWQLAVEPDATHDGLEIRTCRHCGTQESRVKSMSIEENSDIQQSFAYYTNGRLLIHGIEHATNMRIIDILGRVLYTETVSGDYAKELNLATGVYIVTLGDRTQKIVVR